MKHFNKKSGKESLNYQRTSRGLQTPRNQFDMSYHSYFTQPLGMILPCYCEEILPGDHIKIDAANFTRTQPVQTAAFTRFQQNTEFYYVPYRLLWKWWDTLINQVANSKTSLLPVSNGFSPLDNGEKIPKSVPAVKSSDIAKCLTSDLITDGFGLKAKYSINRMLSLLGYPAKPNVEDTERMYKREDGQEFDRSFNIMRFLAYQYIWFDKFRQTDYTRDVPQWYNIDDSQEEFINNLFADPDNPALDDRLINILKARYVQYRKDQFTAIKPNTIGLQASDFNDSQTFSDEYFNLLLPQNMNGIKEFKFGSGQTKPNYGVSENKIYLLGSTNGSSLSQSLESLRGMMSFEKLQRIKSLAGKKFDDQFKAVFGQTSDKANYRECTYLGSFDSMLQIGEVTATASSSTTGDNTSVLGQLAGKGISSGNSRTIERSFDEHGIVLGLTYMLPFAEYDDNRLNAHNQKFTYNDYFNPAYDNLGYQPLNSMQTHYVGNTNNHLFHFDMGFQSRYQEYKTRVDEVHGEFASTGSLRAWTCPRPTFADWMHYNFQTFYVNPTQSNSIFAIAFDGDPKTDPFLNHFSFNVKMDRNMSILGVAGF